jgi:hypothetical protein
MKPKGSVYYLQEPITWPHLEMLNSFCILTFNFISLHSNTVIPFHKFYTVVLVALITVFL